MKVPGGPRPGPDGLSTVPRMVEPDTARRRPPTTIEHAPTGVLGLDDILNGGLPAGRASLLAGGPGCGKSLLGLEILARGCTQFDEPGVLMLFEETTEEALENAAAIGLDLQALVDAGKLAIDHVELRRDRIEQTGDFDLEGLFLRLGLAIDATGAKRVVLDTIETLFATFDDAAVLRAELQRLFRWLKDRGVTAVITAERGEGALTRHGLEEYVSDCVILLDHRVTEQLATRRLRVVKFRGSAHGTSEFPFLIDEHGFSVLPVTSFELDHEAVEDIVSSGVAPLDRMLGRGGYYRGSTIMVSGASGTGKTTIAGHFAAAGCERGERTLLLAFEESPSQIVRNMRSVGLDLQQHVDDGLLVIDAGRPSQFGLESHLLRLYQHLEAFQPTVVVIDPITDFHSQGTTLDIKAMLMRMVDLLKRRGVTALFTSISLDGTDEETAVSSLVDTWVQLRTTEVDGERAGRLYVLKARGMSHSKRVRELTIASDGVHLDAVGDEDGREGDRG